MFKTKKELKRRIANLEAEISHKNACEQISAFIETSNLPKCKGLACVNCEHIIYKKYQGYTFVLGCGKKQSCPDFMKSELSVEDRRLLREDLLSQQGL